ncbi:hypothetical protein ASG01_09275 [Chryseobacterium sp. Leaf180]|nr:hypothetical protein ASG01_09275 [Chryseobacterium sp. Leaf180]
MRNALILFFLSFTYLFAGCGTQSARTFMNDKNTSESDQKTSVAFEEVRRLTTEVMIGTYRIAENLEKTTKLYGLLQDKKFKRSAPIPILEDGEYLLAIQPKMKNEVYGDIEISKIVRSKTGFQVFYREVKNSQYAEEKLKNPVIIVKIKGAVPAKVDLIRI